MPTNDLHVTFRRMAVLTIAIAALLSFPIHLEADSRVTITTAMWDGSGGYVDLAGTADPHGTVFVTDADSGNVLFTTTADGAGTWSDQAAHLAYVPCRVQAASGGGISVEDVIGAPGGCGPPPVDISSAVWDSGTRQLVVSGQCDSYRPVVVRDGDSGVELGTTRSDGAGMWSVNIGDLDPVSCSVIAESDIGAPASASVSGAPAGCGSPQQGAKLFAEKLCYYCHGADGAGNPGKNIQGKGTRDIRRALQREEVHEGIDATIEEARAVAVFLSSPSPLPALPDDAFANPTKCQTCHPRQHKEWSGSMKSYSAQSPTFAALESLANSFAASNGAPGFASGSHRTALFCENCHNPVSSALGEFPTLEESYGRPLKSFAGATGLNGISCEVCHQVSGPSTDTTYVGRLGDGIANNAFVLSPGDTKFGPLQNPEPNPDHSSDFSVDIHGNVGYLRSPEFCGSCHDVRTPPGSGMTEDLITGEPFQRLENLFTEWKNGPYGPINNAVGGIVSCQDCHMGLGPPDPAGTYPEGETTVYPRPREVREREAVATHYFTGVDVALIEDYPGQDDTGRDIHNNVIGQIQRRQILLASAAEMSITSPSVVNAGDILQLLVNVTNSGTGHNLPSGFSQERQCWIELTVEDAAGSVVYQSGHLVDSAHPETGELVPDGNLDDEDLLNFIGTIDPITLEADVVHGPDFNRRHEHPAVYQGVVNFGNEFTRFKRDAAGDPIIDPATGHYELEEVFMPFLSEHMDNSHSIPALETEHVRYDIEVPAGTVGPLTVSSRLRFRAFPPRFLRTLSAGRPDLVTEAMVDRNTIVNMTSATPVSVAVN